MNFFSLSKYSIKFKERLARININWKNDLTFWHGRKKVVDNQTQRIEKSAHIVPCSYALLLKLWSRVKENKTLFTINIHQYLLFIGCLRKLEYSALIYLCIDACTKTYNTRCLMGSILKIRLLNDRFTFKVKNLVKWRK